MNKMFDESNGTKVKLGDVVAQIKDQVNAQTCGLMYYLGGEHLNNDDLHVNGRGVIEGSTIGPAFIMRFKPGHVLLMSRNPHLKKMSVADFEGICSNVTYVLETKTEILLQSYLPFVLKTDDFWTFAERNKRGSTNFYLNWSDFAQFEFTLPSIEEQTRIAKLLWAGDTLVQKYKQNASDVETIQKKLIRELDVVLSQEKDSIFFSDCVEFTSGLVDPRKEPYASMALVAPNHVESGTGQVIAYESASKQNAISGKFLFYKGQVVYSKIRPSLRKAFIASSEGLCSADMYPLVPQKNKLSTNFLLRLILSPRFTEYATTCSVRTSIPKLNRKDMSAFRLYLPSIKFQEAFMKKYDALEKEKYAIIDQIRRVSQILKRIVNNSGGVKKCLMKTTQ